jgi:exodeoxyribonuclease VII small subunit
MDGPGFEELFAALEEKARKLEQGNLPLEDALRLYEEGADLAEKLRAILDSAELRIERLQVRLEEDRSQLREIEAAYAPDDEE